MPIRPLGPCAQPGCPGRATHRGRCERHAEERLQAWREREMATPRPSANARGYDREWSSVRRKQLARYPRCAVCGQPATVVDHITTIRNGGARFDLANLQSLCRDCHALKTNRHDGGFGNPRHPLEIR